MKLAQLGYLTKKKKKNPSYFKPCQLKKKRISIMPLIYF